MDYINRVILLPFRSLDKIQGRLRHVVQTSVADNLTQRSYEMKVRKEQMKLDELEEHGQCCICHQQGQRIEGRRKHDGGMSLLEGKDAAIVSAALGVSVRGYLCPTCEIIRSKIKTRLQAKELKMQQLLNEQQHRQQEMGQFIHHSTNGGIVHHLIPGQDAKVEEENEKKNKLLEVKVEPFIPGRKGLASGPLSLELFRGVTAWPTSKPLDLHIIANPSKNAAAAATHHHSNNNNNAKDQQQQLEGVHMSATTDYVSLHLSVRGIPRLKKRRMKAMDGEEYEYLEEVFSDNSDYDKEDVDDEEEEEDDDDDEEDNNNNNNNKFKDKKDDRDKKKSKSKKSARKAKKSKEADGDDDSGINSSEEDTGTDDDNEAVEILVSNDETQEITTKDIILSPTAPPPPPKVDTNLPRVRAIRHHHHHHHHHRHHHHHHQKNDRKNREEKQDLYFKLIQLNLRDAARRRRQLKRDHLARLEEEVGLTSPLHQTAKRNLEREEREYAANDGVVFVSKSLNDDDEDNNNSNKASPTTTPSKTTPAASPPHANASLTSKEKRKIEFEHQRQKHISTWNPTPPMPLSKLIGADSTGTFLVEVFERKQKKTSTSKNASSPTRTVAAKNDDDEDGTQQPQIDVDEKDVRIGCCSFRIEDLKFGTIHEEGPLELVGTHGQVVGQLFLKKVSVHRYIMPIDRETGEVLNVKNSSIIMGNSSTVDDNNNDDSNIHADEDNTNQINNGIIGSAEDQQEEKLPQWAISALLKKMCDVCHSRNVSLYHRKYRELLCPVCKSTRRHQKECITLTSPMPNHDVCLALMMIVCDSRPIERILPQFRQERSLFPDDTPNLFIQQDETIFSSQRQQQQQKYHEGTTKMTSIRFSEADELLSEKASDRRRLKSATLFAGRNVQIPDERDSSFTTSNIVDRGDGVKENDTRDDESTTRKTENTNTDSNNNVSLFQDSWTVSPSLNAPRNLLERESLLEEIHAQHSPNSRRSKDKNFAKINKNISISLFPNSNNNNNSNNGQQTPPIAGSNNNSINNNTIDHQPNNNTFNNTMTSLTELSDVDHRTVSNRSPTHRSTSSVAPLPLLKDDYDDDDDDDTDINIMKTDHQGEDDDDNDNNAALYASLPRLSIANLQKNEQEYQNHFSGQQHHQNFHRVSEEHTFFTQHSSVKMQRSAASSTATQYTNSTDGTATTGNRSHQHHHHHQHRQRQQQQQPNQTTRPGNNLMSSSSSSRQQPGRPSSSSSQHQIGRSAAASSNNNNNWTRGSSTFYYAGSVSPDSTLSAISSVIGTTQQQQNRRSSSILLQQQQQRGGGGTNNNNNNNVVSQHHMNATNNAELNNSITNNTPSTATTNREEATTPHFSFPFFPANNNNNITTASNNSTTVQSSQHQQQYNNNYIFQQSMMSQQNLISSASSSMISSPVRPNEDEDENENEQQQQNQNRTGNNSNIVHDDNVDPLLKDEGGDVEQPAEKSTTAATSNKEQH